MWSNNCANYLSHNNNNNNNNNDNNFLFLNFILIYKLNIQIQISLIIGNLYSADLITGISSMKKKFNKKN